jgi:hypothetical protein
VDGSGNVSTASGSGLFTAGNGLSWSGTTLSSTLWTVVGSDIERQSGNVYIGDAAGTNNDLYISNRLIDWDNSTYYVDPGSVNRLNEVMFDDGSVSDVSIHFDGDDNTGLFQPADNEIAFSSNGTESIRINASGNLGVGTNAPTQKLDVNGSVRIRGGSPAVGHVLTATSTDGTASWQPALPIGSIVAWHKNGGGGTLPTGWEECDGSPATVNGVTIPNLNGATTSTSGDASLGRFLRGHTSSGVFQADESNNFLSVEQSSSNQGSNGGVTIDDDGNYSGWLKNYYWDDSMRFRKDGVETRVVNMSVVWIIKVR